MVRGKRIQKKPNKHLTSFENSLPGQSDKNPFRERPKTFQPFFDSLEDFILIFALDGRILYANPVLQNHLGYSRDEILSMHITDLHPHDQRRRVRKILSDVMAGKNSTYEIPLITEGNVLIPVETKLARVSWQNQKAILGIFRDVSDRLTAEEALRESKRRLSTLMSNMPGMAYRCQNNKRWTMEFISEGFFNLTGYRPEEFIGDRNVYSDLIHPEDREHVWDEVQKGLSEKKPFTFVFRLRTADGVEKWVWEQGVGVFSDDGKLLALEGFCCDVTDQKKAELQLLRENKLLRSRMQDSSRFGNIIGQSESMQQVYDLILQAADSTANVIIYGESGTGKELVARAIHEMSERRERRFVPVNCGAIPENLIESEFFGYKKGAFSGANRDKPGYLDFADGGTLFLDEVGEINLNMQVKLLRAIESSGYTPVGGNEVKSPDIRIIAATNTDLKDHVNKGLMREDFFYRIHIIPIDLPPLRDRKEDIPLLIFHFVREISHGKSTKSIPQNVMDAMQRHDWPGNIRELQNVIHRYVTLGQIDLLGMPSYELDETRFPVKDGILKGISDLKLQSALEGIEKQLIINALEHHRWHRGRVASSLGVNYRTLMRKMRRYGLSKS
jgi:PAS domain S-box-containing protein